MKKHKSFSAYGKYLENRANIKPDLQLVARNTARSIQNQLIVHKKQPKFIQGFDRVTNRTHFSPFLIFNTKDFNRQANYEPKQQLIQTKSSFFPIRHQTEPRLNKLIYNREYQKSTKICKKYPNEQINQKVVTTRDLQNSRKSFHSMDFNKQLNRVNSYIRTPVTKNSVSEFEKVHNQEELQEKIKDRKIAHSHSFDSYTKRQFLSEKKLSKKAAPSHSGADCFKIPMQKFKGSWKTTKQQEFGTSPQKVLSRYDPVDQPFYTKLGYQPKQDLVTKKLKGVDIKKQTSRQLNEVHSKYPIRLAV